MQVAGVGHMHAALGYEPPQGVPEEQVIFVATKHPFTNAQVCRSVPEQTFPAPLQPAGFAGQHAFAEHPSAHVVPAFATRHPLASREQV